MQQTPLCEVHDNRALHLLLTAYMEPFDDRHNGATS
jgi:hypothetical protein